MSHAKLVEQQQAIERIASTSLHSRDFDHVVLNAMLAIHDVAVAQHVEIERLRAEIDDLRDRLATDA